MGRNVSKDEDSRSRRVDGEDHKHFKSTRTWEDYRGNEAKTAADIQDVNTVKKKRGKQESPKKKTPSKTFTGEKVLLSNRGRRSRFAGRKDSFSEGSIRTSDKQNPTADFP